MDVLGNQGQLLLRLLASTSERAKVIAGNISNQNTPGYLRREHRFEELLVEEMQSLAPDLSRVVAQTVEDEDTPTRGDGNNVTLEHEINDMRETALRYDLYAALLASRTKIVQSAIHGER